MDDSHINDVVVEGALAAARMIATEGLGENQRAHGFLFIIGDSKELLDPDPDLTFAETESSVHSKYGFFPKDLDRREGAEILIQDCCESDAKKRALQTLCARDNAIVVDGTSGRVCCGGFANRDSTTPYGTGSRTRAASSIAVKANCVTIKASEDVCGTRANPIFLDAHFEVFRRDFYPEKVPVVVVVETPSSTASRSFESRLLAIQRHVAAIKLLEESHRCPLRPRLYRKYGTDEYAKVRAKIADFEGQRDTTMRFYVDERRVEEFRDLETGFEEFCRGLPTVYPVAAVLSVENEAVAYPRITPQLMTPLEKRDVATYFHPELELVEFVRGVGPRILIFVGCPLDGVRSYDEEWRLRYFCCSSAGASELMVDFDRDNLIEFTIRIAELALTGVIVKSADLLILRDEFPAECAEAAEQYRRSEVRGERLLSMLLQQPKQDLTIDAINNAAARCEEQLLEATRDVTISDVGPLRTIADRISNFSSSFFANDEPVPSEEDDAATLEEVHVVATEGVGKKEPDAAALVPRPSFTKPAETEAERQDQIEGKLQEKQRREKSEGKSLPSHGASEHFLESCGMSWRRVLERLETNDRALRHLDLRGNSIGVEGAARLAKALEKNTSLQTLDLRDNGIGAEGAARLAESLEKNTSLQTLDLGGNRIGAEGAARLAESLEKNTSLQTLDLGDNRIGAEGAARLAKALEKKTSLQTLDLGFNRIGAEGAARLAESLEKNTSLQTLYLGFNRISAEGAARLAESLEKNTSLQTLNLRSNGIGAEGAARLAESLEKNTSLQTLHLGFNRIGAEGAALLAESLEKNTSLQKLNLRFNPIRDEGATRLAEALEKNKSLQKLYLEDTELSDQVKQRLRAVAEKTGKQISL
ncbi:hypothetical protein CTAYLR_008205 [Chrysophaeum taylorii]|uniref:Uncharacterized protein n=1 Tax=Chrysophaeum taylorii TaxID=2483200 RepID=A0AAD7UCD2_9STRA|nr:hypothetical protein CTAYLR_008205 [Chrysophaeum taylorii]